MLADDHAIGTAVRALGGEVAMPPMVLVHAATERGLGGPVAARTALGGDGARGGERAPTMPALR